MKERSNDQNLPLRDISISLDNLIMRTETTALHLGWESIFI